MTRTTTVTEWGVVWPDGDVTYHEEKVYALNNIKTHEIAGSDVSGCRLISREVTTTPWKTVTTQ